MGIGDNLIAAGMARGAAKRGKVIAFGDGRKVIWDQNSELIFRGNPNVASPGNQRGSRIEWIPFYRGHRIYNRQDGDRWIWNYDFRAQPGEIFLTKEEKRAADAFGRGFILIEPTVPWFKSASPNKQWPVDRYREAARQLRSAGYDVAQLIYPKVTQIPEARPITTKDFRMAMAAMMRAPLYIGPEGGLHHAAAAVGRPAVVLFGGFIPPQVTGYATHTNLTGDAEACGSLKPCAHCRAAMEKITVDEVVAAAMVYLQKDAA